MRSVRAERLGDVLGTRVAPGMATTSSPRASSQASATCPTVAPSAPATTASSARGARAGRRRPQRRRGGEQALPERRVGDERDAELARRRVEAVALDATVEQAPADLVGRERHAVRRERGVRGAHLGGREVADADGANRALAHEPREDRHLRADRRERRRVVNLVEVDRIRHQGGEARGAASVGGCRRSATSATTSSRRRSRPEPCPLARSACASARSDAPCP